MRRVSKVKPVRKKRTTPWPGAEYKDAMAPLPRQIERQIERANIAHAYAHGPGSVEEHYREVIDEIFNAFEKFKILNDVLLSKLRK